MGKIIGQFLFTLFATTNSPTDVVAMKGSFMIWGKISNFLSIEEVTKDNGSPGSSKPYTSIDKTYNIPVTISGELSCSP